MGKQNPVKIGKNGQNNFVVHSFHRRDPSKVRRHFTSSFQFQPGSDRHRQQERMYRRRRQEIVCKCVTRRSQNTVRSRCRIRVGGSERLEKGSIAVG